MEANLKLHTKDIEPYLCHALSGFLKDDRSNIRLMAGINAHDKKITTFTCEEHNISDFVPILHPLSSLKGLPNDDESKAYFDIDKCSVSNLYNLSFLAADGMDFDCLSKTEYDMMCKNKIDFNGLIDKGLAVSIGDIEL